MAQRNVLIVDDDAVILKLMTKFIEGEGLRCVSAPDGEEAVARLEEEPFDLLILDKNLPGISGLVVARMARKIQPGVPILLVTGYSSEESAREAATIPPPRRNPDRAATLRAVFSVMSEPEQGAAPEVRVKVIVIEEDDTTRQAIKQALRALKCPVASYRTEQEAADKVAQVGCQVLIGRPAVLMGSSIWLAALPAGEHLGQIAIMDQGGVDNAIRAIQLGARGMLAPPFHGTSIVHEFNRVVSKLLEEQQD